MPIFLGIDCGTQSTKAIVIDDRGAILGRGSASHDLIEAANGRREQDPQWWIEALIVAVRQAIATAGVDGKAVRALGVSGQQHGLVVLGEDDVPLRPAKLWNDTETAVENATLIARFGGAGAWMDNLGIVPRTGYTISKLLWIRQNEPEIFARIRRILLPHDYLNFWLTGEAVAEAGDASGTAFFNIRNRTWAPAPLALIDGGTGQLAAALPELKVPDALIGALRAEVAETLGLSPGCAVSVGGGDNMMGAIGTGNVREGHVTLSLGTSATLYCHSDRPVIDPLDWVAPFCSSDGGWLPLVCTMNATNVTGGIAAFLGRDVAFLSEALDATAPGADGLTLLPFLNGERTPDLPQATGSLLGITGANLTPKTLARAGIEGVTFGILGGLQRILGDRSPDRILVIGGGARSTPWRQMIADITGAGIVVPTCEEAAALGAALQAMWASDHAAGGKADLADITARSVTFDVDKAAYPDASRSAAYTEAFTRYREALTTLHNV